MCNGLIGTPSAKPLTSLQFFLPLHHHHRTLFGRIINAANKS
jgi:hypothetical protein